MFSMSKAVKMLKRDEGVEHRIYRCSAGARTIGVGRNLDANPLTGEELEYLFTHNGITGTGLTDYGIDHLLMRDISKTYQEVKDLQRDFFPMTPISPVRALVLINMAFNLGPARIRRFVRFLAAMKKQDWPSAAREMLDSTWAKQVGARAERLADMMLEG